MNRVLTSLQHFATVPPNKLALIGESADSLKQLTYGELWQAVEQAKQVLQQCNIQRLALRADNGINWAIADLAAIAAGVVLVPVPVFAACAQGNIELDTYIAFLTQAYHHVKHTVSLLMTCGSRLPEKYEWLRQALGEYIEEEKGHHEWILNDLQACGVNTSDVREDRGQGNSF